MMSKGHKRSNREVRKPKQNKPKATAGASLSTVEGAMKVSPGAGRRAGG